MYVSDPKIWAEYYRKNCLDHPRKHGRQIGRGSMRPYIRVTIPEWRPPPEESAGNTPPQVTVVMEREPSEHLEKKSNSASLTYP